MSNEKRHLCRRLLLGRRGRLSPASGRPRRRLRLHRRTTEHPTYRAGLRPRHRPRRGGRGDLRSARASPTSSCSTRSGRSTIRRSSTAKAPTSATSIARRSSRTRRAGARGDRVARSRADESQAPDRDADRSRAAFWPAEEYHQRYFEKNGGAACHVMPAIAMKRGELSGGLAATPRCSACIRALGCAGQYAVTHTDAEWRKILGDDRY